MSKGEWCAELPLEVLTADIRPELLQVFALIVWYDRGDGCTASDATLAGARGKAGERQTSRHIRLLAGGRVDEQGHVARDDSDPGRGGRLDGGALTPWVRIENAGKRSRRIYVVHPAVLRARASRTAGRKTVRADGQPTPERPSGLTVNGQNDRQIPPPMTVRSQGNDRQIPPERPSGLTVQLQEEQQGKNQENNTHSAGATPEPGATPAGPVCVGGGDVDGGEGEAGAPPLADLLQHPLVRRGRVKASLVQSLARSDGAAEVRDALGYVEARGGAVRNPPGMLKHAVRERLGPADATPASPAPADLPAVTAPLNTPEYYEQLAAYSAALRGESRPAPRAAHPDDDRPHPPPIEEVMRKQRERAELENERYRQTLARERQELAERNGAPAAPASLGDVLADVCGELSTSGNSPPRGGA